MKEKKDKLTLNKIEKEIEKKHGKVFIDTFEKPQKGNKK